MAMLTAITIAIALFVDLFFLPTLLIALDKLKFNSSNKKSLNMKV
jgi:predicted RND superfamily exporter protein